MEGKSNHVFMCHGALTTKLCAVLRKKSCFRIPFNQLSEFQATVQSTVLYSFLSTLLSNRPLGHACWQSKKSLGVIFLHKRLSSWMEVKIMSYVYIWRSANYRQHLSAEHYVANCTQLATCTWLWVSRTSSKHTEQTEFRLQVQKSNAGGLYPRVLSDINWEMATFTFAILQFIANIKSQSPKVAPLSPKVSRTSRSTFSVWRTL